MSEEVGFAFGAFWKSHPGLDFSTSQAAWTSRHYQFIASLLNYENCGNQTDVVGSNLALEAYLNETQLAYSVAALRTALLNNATWPHNPVWQRLKWANCTAIDLANTQDQTYLWAYWTSHLTPYRCVYNRECARRWNDPASVCVLDEVPYVPWLNGGTGSAVTSSTAEQGFGNAGGCACPPAVVPRDGKSTGFRDQATFCLQCLPGYGPPTNDALQTSLIYQSDLVQAAGLNYLPIFDPSTLGTNF